MQKSRKQPFEHTNRMNYHFNVYFEGSSLKYLDMFESKGFGFRKQPFEQCQGSLKTIQYE